MLNTVQNGKGSKPRPIIKKIYDENFDIIFSKKKTVSKAKSITNKKGKTTYKY